MKPLRITATLASSAIACYDDYSPSLDGLLSYLWFDRRGENSANVSREEARQADIPIQKLELNGEWYYACSSPHYWYTREGRINYRKRHDPDYTGHISKEQKWSAQSGEFKSYDLPLFYRVTERITWFAAGDKDGVFDLLQDCKALGKKTSFGNGFVAEDGWKVEEVEYDYHLIGPQGQLMKPVPFRLLNSANDFQIIDGCRLTETGWRPPARFNTEVCAVPKSNAVFTGGDYAH